jgi:uncharacterized protein involved in outer membrane biogenesis
MIIKNLVKNDDGSYDFDFSVDAVEAEFLMDHAIKNLIREGIIKTVLDEKNELAQMEFDLNKETLQ